MAALTLWAGCLTAFAATPGTRFDAANQLYEEGKYPQAIAAYENLAGSGTVSEALYFNLGNAFFKSGKLGQAIAAYRHAEQIDPRDPDLRANLRFVRDRIQGPTLLPNRWERWLGRLTVNEWAVLTSIAFWACLLLLGISQLQSAWKPRLRTPILCSGTTTAALGACLAASLLATSSPTAIVIASQAAVRNGPLDQSQTAFTVHDGAELHVLDHKDHWLQVSAGNRRIGWMKRDQAVVWPPNGTPTPARSGS